MAKQKKLCPQFHLSLQSGCDATLKRMNRHYTADEYRTIVRNLRAAFENAAITTDIMVGFAGETDEEFAESLAFAEEIAFAKVHVFAYSRRPGTRAYDMGDQLTNAVKEARSHEMIRVTTATQQAFFKAQIGRTEEVLFEREIQKGVWEGCSETPQMMPLPVVLAHRLTGTLTFARKSGMIQGLRPDGKAQVTVEYDEDGKPLRLDTIVLSAQHSPKKPIDELYWELTDKVLTPALQAMPPDEDTKILLNPSGRFVLGGPEADTGLTGRKLMVDSYGVFAPHGGGAFSGKDSTKVDRSGAYMARYIAKNLVAAGLCAKCQITLAYAIGKAEPVMVEVDTFGTGMVCADDCLAEAVKLVFGLTPAEIISRLDLLTPRYTQTAAYGHFGKPEFPWERTDQAKALRAAVI